MDWDKLTEIRKNPDMAVLSFSVNDREMSQTGADVMTTVD